MIASIRFTFPASTHPERGFHRPREKGNISTDPKVLPTNNINAMFTISSEAFEMRENGKLSIQKCCH